MQKIHTKLTQKYQFYNKWHQSRHHNKVHWGVLGVFTFVFGITFWYSTPMGFAADILAPTTPANLTAIPSSSLQIDLSWTTSTDDVGVAGYKIYRDGIQVATVNSGSSDVSFNIQPYTKGNISNFPIYPKSTAYEPSKGECVSDSDYKAEVCKVVDKNEFPTAEISNVVRPVYSRWRIDNSDGTKYFLVKDGSTPNKGGKGQMVILNSSDNSIYRIVKEVYSAEAAEFRWDYSGSNPNTMYYISSCSFNEYDITTGQSTLIRDFQKDFPTCGRILNDVEGDSSRDSRYWAFMVQDTYDGTTFPMRAVITYDKLQNTIIGKFDYASYVSVGGTVSTLPKPNMVDISPLGTKVVLLNGRSWGKVVTVPGPWVDEGDNVWSAPYQIYTSGNNVLNWAKSDEIILTKQNSINGDNQWKNDSFVNKLYIRLESGVNPETHNITVEYGNRPGDLRGIIDGPHAFDLDFTNPVKVCNDETHGGWGFDYNGDEVYVCQINNSNWPNAEADTIAYTNIKTGETKTILYHADLGWDVGGFHFGRFYNTDIRGWVYMTTVSPYETSKSWMRNQAVMLELKPYDQHPRVWRISDTHNNYPGISGYPREAYSPITADGKYVYWGADWPGGDGTVDTYRVKLPDEWWIKLKKPFLIKYSDKGLNPKIEYMYTVSAYDSAGNESAQSTPLSATTLASYKQSDLNQDTKTNQQDFDILKQNFNRTDKPSSDINQDGIIDSKDLGILMSEWSE